MSGDRIGRYDVHEVLGAGGFATVFRATDPRLDAPVAIKVLAENWSIDPEVRARFRTEAVLLRRVQSEGSIPGVIEVFDIDQTDDGRPFFVMGFADKGTLTERAGRGPWTQREVVPVIEALADTVGALHEADVVHRDLKPSNLLLRSDRRANADAEADGLVRPGERLVVGDLGLAKDLTAENTALSIGGGTGQYMAPEQLDPTKPVDHRADVYAASELIAGLLRGRDGATSLEEETAAVLDRGRATTPGDRFASMAAWRTALLEAFAESRARKLLASDPLGDGSGPAKHEGDGSAKEASRAKEIVRAKEATSESSDNKSALAGAGLAIGGGVLAIAFAASQIFGGGDNKILGPDSIETGQTVRYRADADTDAVVTWTDWTGAKISQQDLEVRARLPGSLTFSLDIDGEQFERTVTVDESTLGPSIVGPETLDSGASGTYEAELQAADQSHYWIDADGQRVDSDDLIVSADSATGDDVGSVIIALVAVDADGVERGTRRTIGVNS